MNFGLNDHLLGVRTHFLNLKDKKRCLELLSGRVNSIESITIGNQFEKKKKKIKRSPFFKGCSRAEMATTLIALSISAVKVRGIDHLHFCKRSHVFDGSIHLLCNVEIYPTSLKMKGACLSALFNFFNFGNLTILDDEFDAPWLIILRNAMLKRYGVFKGSKDQLTIGWGQESRNILKLRNSIYERGIFSKKYEREDILKLYDEL